MELHDVMRTTFAAREFTDEPLPDAVLERILDSARFAASGGNRQGWRVIVVRDAQDRATLADLMMPAMRRYVAQVQAGENPWNPLHPAGPGPATIDATAVPEVLLTPYHQAQVVLLVLLDLGVVAAMDQYLDRIGVAGGASIYPFAWNILLAARNEGYGGVLTTFLVAEEARVKAHFAIPEPFAVAAAIPIGKPVRQLTRLRRKPVADFTTRDRFDGPPFGA